MVQKGVLSAIAVSGTSLKVGQNFQQRKLNYRDVNIE